VQGQPIVWRAIRGWAEPLGKAQKLRCLGIRQRLSFLFLLRILIRCLLIGAFLLRLIRRGELTTARVFVFFEAPLLFRSRLERCSLVREGLRALSG